MSNKTGYWITIAIFCLIVGVITYQCYHKPLYNWDTLCYGALILSVEEKDHEKVHETVFALAKEEVPSREFFHMIDTTHQLRKRLLNDSQSFFQFLSYFKIKPLYTFSSYLAYKAGVPLMKAPVVPSVISFLLISVLLFGWLSKYFVSWLSAVLSLSILCSPPVLEAARLATPDALSALFMLIAAFQFLNNRQWYWIALSLSFSLLIRLDNILPATLILVGLLLIHRKNDARFRLPVIVITILAWILYTVLIYQYADAGFDEFYGGLNKKFNPFILISESIAGLATLQTSHLPVPVIICGVVLFYQKKLPHQYADMNLYQTLFLILALSTLIKYIIFPDLTTRLHLSLYLSSWIIILITLKEKITNDANRR